MLDYNYLPRLFFFWGDHKKSSVPLRSQPNNRTNNSLENQPAPAMVTIPVHWNPERDTPNCIQVSLSNDDSVKTHGIPVRICRHGSIEDNCEEPAEYHVFVLDDEQAPYDTGCMAMAYIMIVKPGCYTGEGRLFGVTTKTFIVFKCTFDTTLQRVDMVFNMSRLDSKLTSILNKAAMVRKVTWAEEKITKMCRTIPRKQKNDIVRDWQEECDRNGDLCFYNGIGYAIQGNSKTFRTIIRNLKRRLRVDSKTLREETLFDLEVCRQLTVQSKIDRTAVKDAAKREILTFYKDTTQREDFDEDTPCDLLEEVSNKKGDPNYTSPIGFVNRYPISILVEASREAQEGMNQLMSVLL